MSGSDKQRKKELILAFRDKSAGMIMGIRGGYGCTRIAQEIISAKEVDSFDGIFCGFSDLTVISLILLKKGMINFYGPMLSPDFSDLTSDFSFEFLIKLASGDDMGIHKFPEGWRGLIEGVAEGELTGGCLSLLQTSLKTKYEFDSRGKILAFEDTGESPYRIDRILTHLLSAGKFEGVKGVLVGRFASCPEQPPSCEEVVAERLSVLKCPVVVGADFGHIKNKITLPLGLRVRLDSKLGTLEFLEKAVEV